MRSGNAHRRGENGNPAASSGTIEQVRQLYKNYRSNSIWDASLQLNVPHSLSHRKFCKNRFFRYGLQNIQVINGVDMQNGMEFAEHAFFQLRGYFQ